MAFKSEKQTICPQNYRRFLRLFIKLLPVAAAVLSFAGCATLQPVSENQKISLLKSNNLIAILNVEAPVPGSPYLQISFQNLALLAIKEAVFVIIPYSSNGDTIKNKKGESAILTLRHSISVLPDKIAYASWHLPLNDKKMYGKRISYFLINAIKLTFVNGEVVYYEDEQINGMVLCEYGPTNPSQKQNTKSDKGFYMYSGFIYNHESIDPDPIIINDGLNVLLGMGYDFGPVSLNLAGDFMMISNIQYASYRYSRPEIKDAFNAGIGASIGVKLLNSRIFDVTLPLGILFRASFLNVSHDDKREFMYLYLNAETGLVPAVWFSRYLALEAPFSIGYPVYKYHKITNYKKNDFDVFNYSIGLCLKLKF